MEKIIKIGQVPLKIFLFLILNDLFDTSAQLLMKKGIHYSFDFAHHDCFFFWVGVSIYIFNFFLWMFILSKINLSVALPLASIGYILIPLASVIFLHEHILPTRWIGLVLIVTGIYFISKSQPKAQDNHE
ncbi:MAG: EamA family transporter [Candidatus Omnitrophica bacterium]|nr:EamA family transporter [Candidatus Omnitrophota bacterium]